MRSVSQYVGMPFKDGGRGPDEYDCWGLVKAIYADNGIDLPDFFIKCLDTALVHKAFEAEQESPQWVRLDEPEPLCVIAMAANSTHPDMCSHFGVYIGSGRFIHTNEQTNAIISRVNDFFWRKRILGYWKWNGC